MCIRKSNQTVKGTYKELDLSQFSLHKAQSSPEKFHSASEWKSPAQCNTTFPSNYIEFPLTGMKVVMHEASSIPMRMCHVPNWCTCNPFHKRGHTCDNAPKKLTDVLYGSMSRLRKNWFSMLFFLFTMQHILSDK